MALCILVRRAYGEKSQVSIKFHNLHSFKEGMILLCQSILYNLLKNKMYNTTKLEAHNQRVHQSTQGQLYCGLTSYELLMYVQIRVFVYWVMRVMSLYGCREGHELQSLIKTTSSSHV